MPRIIIETPGELLLKVLQTGKVSTNVFLRRLHNCFAWTWNWLPWPLIPKRQWPAVRFKDKRAITLEEHQRKIIAAEVNPERKTTLPVMLALGRERGDIANLKGEDVDWTNGTVSFVRERTGVPVIVHLGAEAFERVQRPASGRRIISLISHGCGRTTAADGNLDPTLPSAWHFRP